MAKKKKAKAKALKTAKKASKKTSKKVTKKVAKKTSKKAAKSGGKASKKSSKKGAGKGSPKKASSKKKAAPKSSGSKAPQMPEMKLGEVVKDFTLESTGGKSFKLSDAKGKAIVLYFYPKDATPGCTLEGQDFTRLHEEFKGLNAEVYGISRDNMKSHENFKAKQNYSVELLSDPKEEACAIFGVIKEKNMYGRKMMGVERSTFVIDQEGKLAKEWRSVKVPGHAEEVLDFVKTL